MKHLERKKSVIDLHCDLLCYLAEIKDGTIQNTEARCSLPQLKEGGVTLQAMAVFTETKKGSRTFASKQIEAYKKFGSLGFSPLKSLKTPLQEGKVHTVLAIENASGLLEEDENLDLVFHRLDALQKEGPLLYISLTWNTENRFAGGNYSNAGLKPDGVKLLEYLDRKNIAIDLSHTSDATADGILETIDKKRLKILPIASHSNFRTVKEHVRNLPDRLALEIIKRGGVMGINFVRSFVGDAFENGLLKMVEHAEKLNGLESLCFGADFFYENSVPTSLNPLVPFFVPPFDTACCYPKVLELFKSKMNDSILNKICSENVMHKVLERP